MAEIFKIDLDKNMISSSDSWNQNLVNSVKVEGEKRVPSISRMLLQKSFAVSPNSIRTKENLQKVQEVTTLSKVNWNEDRVTNQIDTDEQGMLFSFEEPLLIGSGNFKVIYGDPANIHKIGSQAHDTEDRPAFIEVTLTGVTGDYFVMCSNRNEFRVCTAEDFDDMVDDNGNWQIYPGGGNVGSGAKPSSRLDVRTTSHFYLKQMNGAYGRNDTKYIVYKTKTNSYYIDANGIVQAGTMAVNNADQSIFTAYPEKAADIIVKPVDLSGNPLFEYHGISGNEGYNNDTNYANVNDISFAMQIQKVQVDAETVDVKYINWSEITQFFTFSLSGYPLSFVETLVHEIEPDKEEIRKYGRKSASVKNEYMSQSRQIAFLAHMIREENHEEKNPFSYKMMFFPFLEMEDVIRLTDDDEFIDLELTEVVHRVGSSGSTTSINGNKITFNKTQEGIDTFDDTFDETMK